MIHYTQFPHKLGRDIVHKQMLLDAATARLFYLRMQSRPSSFWILYTTLAALILVRLLPYVTGFGPLWGLAHLIFLPLGYTIGYCALGAIALALPWWSKSTIWGERLAGWISGSLYESRFGSAVRIGTAVVFGALFWTFSMPTHFLGDGYPYLANLGSTAGTWVKWTEGGAMQAVLAIQSVAGTTSQSTAEFAFRILSVGSGVITIWFFLLIARLLSDNPVARILGSLALLLSPALLLFFGYVETYPLMWGPLAGFLYFSLARIRTGRGATGAAICLLLAAAAHLMALIFVPAFLYVIFSRGRGLELFKKFKTPAIALFGAAAVALAALFYLKYTGDLYFQNLFLWPFSGKPIAPGYAIFSVPHLRDVVNELLLVSPLLPILLVLAWGGTAKLKQNRSAVLLGIGSICVLVFLLVFDPSLTMPRDWDLFAICGLPVTLFLLAVIPKRNLASVLPLVISLAIASLLFLLPNLMVNLDRNRSITEFKSIIDSFPEKSLGSMAILGTYYRMEGDHRRNDSCESRMQQVYPRLYQMRKARQAIADRNLRAADLYFSQIKPDKYWKDYHLFLAERFMYVNQLDSALIHAQLAIQLQRYNAPSYVTLGLVYMQRNDLPMALETLRRGLSMDSRLPSLLLNLSVICAWSGQNDSSLAYAQRLYDADSTSELGSCLLARGYYFAGNRAQALVYARRYLDIGRGSEEYDKLKGELIQLMPELGSAAPRDSANAGQ